jgi:beta-glucosidase
LLPFEDYSMQGRTYRYFTGDPLYPFGYGLSYSKFRYSPLVVNPNTDNKSLLHISAQVENTSDVQGAEVVQLYVGREHQQFPIRQLSGFRRIQLASHESRSVEFDFKPEDISRGPEGTGRLVISIGGGQPLGSTSYVETKY